MPLLQRCGPDNSFTYDGLGRLVRVVDTAGTSVTADHSYTWCGATLCLAHDNTQTGSPVSTQYFSQGVIASGTSYYYVRDQLGSVRQLIGTAGSVVSQFSYDPYGNRTTVSGSVVPTIGYAGYFTHSVSGLDFTAHRAYDPVHARWLNRDPTGESGGINLYAYVRGNPLRWSDPLGLCPGVDPNTGALTPAAQQALDTWNTALNTESADRSAGNYEQATVDAPYSQWAAANYLYQIAQGPDPGPAPQAPRLAQPSIPNDATPGSPFDVSLPTLPPIAN